MELTDSQQVWIESALRAIAFLPVPKDSDDHDVVASIWHGTRLATGSTHAGSITAQQVRDARAIYLKITDLPTLSPQQEESE